MTARERAEELRQSAIKELLDEKAAIEEMLDTLGYQKENAPQTMRRGRPKKVTQLSEIEPQLSRDDMIESIRP